MDKMEYEKKKTQIMFAADTKIVELPQGSFTVECKGGDVWIFLGDEDRILHEGEVLTVKEATKIGTMRKLYSRGHVKFKVTPLEDNTDG